MNDKWHITKSLILFYLFVPGGLFIFLLHALLYIREMKKGQVNELNQKEMNSENSVQTSFSPRRFFTTVKTTQADLPIEK